MTPVAVAVEPVRDEHLVAAIEGAGGQIVGLDDARVLVWIGPPGEFPELPDAVEWVALKTAGLLALMVQSGLHVPARSSSTFPVFRSIFADIGDDQSIGSSLSTFSAHLAKVVRMERDPEEQPGSQNEDAAITLELLAPLLPEERPCLDRTPEPGDLDGPRAGLADHRLAQERELDDGRLGVRVGEVRGRRPLAARNVSRPVVPLANRLVGLPRAACDENCL